MATFTGEVMGLRRNPRTVKAFVSGSRWIHSPSSFDLPGVVLLTIFTKLQAGSVRVTSAPRGDGLAKKPRQFSRKFTPAISAQYSSCSWSAGQSVWQRAGSNTRSSTTSSRTAVMPAAFAASVHSASNASTVMPVCCSPAASV